MCNVYIYIYIYIYVYIVKDALKDQHVKYVITPIDKANGNVALICIIYVFTLFKELGITNSQHNYDVTPSISVMTFCLKTF